MKKNSTKIYASISFCILIIVASTTINGQSILDQKSFNDFLEIQQKASLSRTVLSERDIKGSPYLNKEFELGSIVTKENVQYTDVPLRYNIYNDDIEFEVGKDSYLAISNPSSLKEIRIGNDTFIHSTKRNKKGEQSGFYKLLADGEVQLLSRLIIVFKEATSTTGYNQAEPAKFNRNANKHYLKIRSSEPKEISNKRDIDQIFGKDSRNIHAFIKKEKLNIREEEDLLKVVAFINKMKF